MTAGSRGSSIQRPEQRARDLRRVPRREDGANDGNAGGAGRAQLRHFHCRDAADREHREGRGRRDRRPERCDPDRVLSRRRIDGTEEKEIVIKRGDKETRYSGMQFLLGHAVPNFYFHVTTTYNILRHNGIEIGKRDYLGNP